LPHPRECGTKVEVTLPSRHSLCRRPAFGLAALVVATGVCRHARADEFRLTLNYTAPPECPPAEAMQSAVQRLATKQTKPYSASVVIENDQQSFKARITSSDGTERDLVGATCDEVAEATAVVLALAISPSSQGEATNHAPPSLPQPRPSKPAPRQARPSSVHLKLGAAAVLDLGTMPQLDLGFSGRVGATARLWSAALEAAYWVLPQHSSPTNNPAVGGDFSWWALLATGCLVPTRGTPRVELCAGPELGYLAGQGTGLVGATRETKLRLGFQALAEVHVPLSERLRLRAGLGVATVVLGQHAFYIDGGELYRPQLFAGRAAVGAEFIF
jgi:hypothetical protein